MVDLYLIRYSEIGLKGPKVRKNMERMLSENIKVALSIHGTTRVFTSNGRILVETEIREDTVNNLLRKVFGIRSFSKVVCKNFSTIDEISKICLDLYRDSVTGKKFAVRCRRTGSHPFNSKDVERVVGSSLYPLSAGVDLNSPDIWINLELRDRTMFIYTSVMDGPGGLPLGSQGAMVSLMSGGIDSPVASWFMMKRGAPVHPIFFSLAHPVDTLSFLKTAKALFSHWSCGVETNVFIVDARPFLKLTVSGKVKFPNVTFKMLLYRVAERIADLNGLHGIVTGESLGQVSSQTAENLEALDSTIKKVIYRPLIGLDKEEIVGVARRIGTFPEKDPGEFCSLFASRPVVSITAEELLSDNLEENLIEELTENALRIKTGEIDSYIGRMASFDLSYRDALKGAIFVDMRSRNDYERSHIPGAVNVQINKLPEFMESITREHPVVFYCKKGLQSAYAASLLNDRGFTAFYTDERIISNPQ